MGIAESVLPGAVQVRLYAEKLLNGIDESIFARKPNVAGTRIEINHAAFNFGHLSIYPVQLARMFSLPTDGMEVPESYFGLFKIGSPCHDDSDGTIYPPMKEIAGHFRGGYDTLLKLFPSIPDELFSKPMEDPNRKDRFPTIGAFLVYLVQAHPQVHLGQISAWRRCFGLSGV